MFSIAEPKMEYKEEAIRCYSVKFQENHFRPCVGLMHWVRWGRYILDIRPLREYLGLPKEDKELYIQSNKAVFEERIKQITDAVGDKDFFALNAKVNEQIIEKRKQEEEKSKQNNQPYDSNLGF
jgi:hypothetical protein